jgi:DNA-directed RNA polymerase subunit RPC12/RpoP
MNKKCIQCGNPITKKNGMVNGRQFYKCHACSKQFLGGDRLDPRTIFNEYIESKQTYGQLAGKYGCSVRTIQR